MIKIRIHHLKNAVAILIGCVIALMLFEVFLRIYNPIHFTVRGDNITLPTNVTFRHENDDIPNIDKHIVEKRNALGFRGAELPTNPDSYLSIIAVGGSTTECYYISEGKTWIDLLANKLRKNFAPLWANNAGINGHSTYGHSILIKNYISKIKPKVVLFLVGVNDIQRSDESSELQEMRLNQNNPYSFREMLNYLASKTETFYLIQNIYRSRQAAKRNLYTKPINVLKEDTLLIPDMDKQTQNASNEHSKYLTAYANSLNKLIDITISNSIVPVLITQPILYGNTIDNSTGTDLGKLKFDSNTNGELQWNIMEMYNDVTRKTASNKNIFMIDLAKELNKDSSYYYDWLHYTNIGAEHVAEILSKRLCPFLAEKYPEFSIGRCM